MLSWWGWVTKTESFPVSIQSASPGWHQPRVALLPSEQRPCFLLLQILLGWEEYRVSLPCSGGLAATALQAVLERERDGSHLLFRPPPRVRDSQGWARLDLKLNGLLGYLWRPLRFLTHRCRLPQPARVGS